MSTTPTPPKGLRTPGCSLWKRITGNLPSELEFDARDLDVLGRAARLADAAADLQDIIDRDARRSQPLLHRA